MGPAPPRAPPRDNSYDITRDHARSSGPTKPPRPASDDVAFAALSKPLPQMIQPIPLASSTPMNSFGLPVATPMNSFGMPPRMPSGQGLPIAQSGVPSAAPVMGLTPPNLFNGSGSFNQPLGQSFGGNPGMVAALGAPPTVQHPTYFR